MNTEILVITDNTPGKSLTGEWGLCFLIKHRGKKILLDAGASELFLKNMEGLGENVEDADYAVLSHAHYDHADGMPYFFDRNTKAKLYIRDGVAADCYHKKLLFRKYIGVTKKLLTDYSERIERVSGLYELMEGAYLLPHDTPNLSKSGKREKMYRRSATGWMYDDFSHEQSLVLETEKGLLIINSCSHGGVVNTINEVRRAFPDKKVYGYIGGFHLFNKTKKEILEVAEGIKEADLEYVCTGHCTKERAFDILKEQLGDILEQLHVGLRIIV